MAHLAEGLQQLGVEVVVYTNKESTVNAERRWIYERSDWPVKNPEHAFLKDLNHEAWAVHDAAGDCEIIHVQAAPAIALSRFIKRPMVLTLHGPHDSKLSEFCGFYPEVNYVCISDAQCKRESMPRMRTVHHGIDLTQYKLVEQKQHYLSFIGRIAPLKGTHIAIDVAQRTGIPLKIAGDVQPMYREYFERKIRPQIDGRLVDYIGLADLQAKNELLGNSMAMLFPIQWNEPFGLVMVEAMACGTPVLAMPGGSVPEVVREGLSGHICRTVVQMSKRVRELNFSPRAVRQYVEENFSIERMAREYAGVYNKIVAETPARKIA